LDLNRPRLPIDRVFSMSGFGTVVTGTLLDGQLVVGDEVQILPSGQRGRVRGLQTHKQKEERAVPGSRTAVNISGIETESVRRGEVVVRPNQYQPARRIDARFRLLKDVSSSLKHNSEVKFFVGASETIANLRLLDTEELSPDEGGWIQLELRDPVVAVRGDRYILRRPSPGETLGGGVIVDHQPQGRHKRFDENVLKSLESLMQGTPSDVLFEAALALNIASIKEVVARSRLEPATAEAALKELLDSGSLVPLEEGLPAITSDFLVIARPHWNAVYEKVLDIIGTYHKNYPLRRGIPREELKSRLKLSAQAFNAILRRLLTAHTVTDYGAFLAQPEHKIIFNSNQQVKIQALMQKFEQNPFSPPSVKECQAEVGEEILNALVELNELITVSSDVVFRKGDYDLMVDRIKKELQHKDKITLGEVRDLFNTSRKYAQALLEHLDSTGITMRDGDFRKLRRK
ncbi:MAG TPA: SelB C-terminal domain-containing protein, partial [Anaerolineales bacterium]|nr:SelB C-terminal domain-containing protein [Anaerolineales bacterium]